MNCQVKKKLGSSELSFEIAVSEHMEFFKQLRFISELPDQCGNCKSEDLRVTYQTPQKQYEYGGVACNACSYQLKFGIHKNDERTMFSKGWERPYEAGADSEEDGEDGAEEQTERRGFGVKRSASAPVAKPTPKVGFSAPKLAKAVAKPTAPVYEPEEELEPEAEVEAEVDETEETEVAVVQKPVVAKAKASDVTVGKLRDKYNFGAPNTSKVAAPVNKLRRG